MSASETDRRRSRRYPVSLRILFRRNETAFFLDTETVNVSEDGAFIKTRRRPLDVGTEVALIFNDLPGFDSSTVLRGVVTRVREDATPLEPRGMGLAFEQIDDDVRERLAAALENLEED